MKPPMESKWDFKQEVLLADILLKCLKTSGIKNKFHMNPTIDTEETGSRLRSLDFMRGFIMFLLMLESTSLYEILYKATEKNILGRFFIQFQHHPWNGLHFWDLIQPGFMFIAGTAMALSISKMKEKGIGKAAISTKMFKRCGWLFFWGVLNYAVHDDGLSFELWNVLTQLSFTLLIAFLIFEWDNKSQIIVCALLLLLTEAMYRFINMPGFDKPFTDQQNFGNYVDVLLMNKINHGGWVAINCIPTSAHTIAGALVGKWLMESNVNKIKGLMIWGVSTLLIGLLLNFFQITPIIKKIATSSFTLASLGWCLIGLAGFYYLIDMKGKWKNINFFNILGMNSIFIYLFYEIVGHRWFNEYINQISIGLLGIIALPKLLISLISCGCIFLLEWKLCQFLYKRKIFFRL